MCFLLNTKEQGENIYFSMQPLFPSMTYKLVHRNTQTQDAGLLILIIPHFWSIGCLFFGFVLDFIGLYDANLPELPLKIILI